MKRPIKDLKRATDRVIAYIKYLEERVEAAEAYAAKHAEMYVREQDRKGKEEASQ